MFKDLELSKKFYDKIKGPKKKKIPSTSHYLQSQTSNHHSTLQNSYKVNKNTPEGKGGRGRGVYNNTPTAAVTMFPIK